MKNILSERFATLGLIIIFSIVIPFHILVILGMIPFTIIGGGRVENETQMMQVEIIAILINAIMLAIVLMKAGFLRWQLPSTVIKISLWVMTILFVLNTIGNIFSKSEIERALFTPLTLVLAFFSFRLAISKKEN